MTSSQTQLQGSGLEFKIVGRVLNTLGVIFLSICVALAASLYEDLPTLQRTIMGLSFAAFMVLAGEFLSRRLSSNWFPLTLMSSGYALAYFFIYATYYVPGLHVLPDPYACWVLGPVLGLIGTWHGTVNRSLRWFASLFTLLVGGHAMYQALSSSAVLVLFGGELKVQALACFASTIYAAGLSALYKRFELKHKWSEDSLEESADWLVNRVLHEVYFVLAAVSAMALPIFLSSFEQAPIWWSIEAPILLALNWRSGNILKHVTVGGVWVAAAGCMLSSALLHDFVLSELLFVAVSGIGMGLSYRMLSSTFKHEHKVAAYCLYTYAALAVSLLAPYLFAGGIWDAMPYWMVESLLLCGLGLALRDANVHRAGTLAGLASLALFAIQWQSWNWALVVPVVAFSYALSIAYARIRHQGGWKQTDFLPFGGETVSVELASKLETLWSWVGASTLIAASYLLLDKEQVVLYWSVEALALIALGFVVSKLGFRLQGLAAFALATAKLVVLDMSGGSFNWTSETAFTLYRSVEFGVLGGSSLLASFLYFREEARLKLLSQKPQAPEGPALDGAAPEASTENRQEQSR